ncbi:MAG TPA: class I SAM-dependent methyltransferase [Tepidisphaeraceae bacterium]|nr:class I SAM-dependent methyltransferase [Tepidisphaeraceae bacterium]
MTLLHQSSTWLPLLTLAAAPAALGQLLPILFGYRPGPVGRLGCVVSLALSLLALTTGAPAWLAPLAAWLCLPFLLAATLTCGVALFDRHPRAVPAAIAIASIAATALTLPFVNGASPAYAAAVALSALLAAALIPTPAVAAVLAGSADVRLPAAPANHTRRARSLPRKLVRTGDVHFLPLYHLLRLSTLAREGMDHSGSYRFADHIYANRPAGRFGIGALLDRALLRLPATRAFHQRYREAAATLADVARRSPARPARVLAVPCGIPRDLAAALEDLRRAGDSPSIEYHGLDLDPDVLRAAADFVAHLGVPFHFHRGDALDPTAYAPLGQFDLVISTGLGEFLPDDDLARLYANAHAALAPGGVFFTSATAHDPRSDALLARFELVTRYRTPAQIAALLAPLPWARVDLVPHPSGLQTFVRAVR